MSQFLGFHVIKISSSIQIAKVGHRLGSPLCAKVVMVMEVNKYFNPWNERYLILILEITGI